MNLLLYSAYYEPEIAASLYLSVNLYEGFAQYGWNALLYVPTPTRGIDKTVRSYYKNHKIEYKVNNQLRITRVPLFREGKNAIQRAIRYILMNIQFIWKGIYTKADIIFVQSTPPTQGAMAAIIKKIKKIPVVYNVQDVFPDSMVSMGMTKKGSLIWKIGRGIERFTYKNADKIVVISESMKQLLMQKGVEENKLEVIYNWVETEKVTPVERSENDLFDELNLDRNTFYVVYAGNLGLAQNISIILQAAKQFENMESIKFLIFGQGSKAEEYKREAKELKLENISFWELMPYEKVSFVYSLGNVGLVSCKAGFGGSALPSKTWTIMATGTPVIASFDEGTDLQRIIQNSNGGKFCKADDVQMLVSSIMELYENQDLCRELGKNARKYVENYLSKEVCVKKYIDVIETCLK